ncbi:hypothetical protein C0J52_18899 [Blattella germanica]|nr:hypothetical protein C0J52_18899 [Blattella germanica]
MECQYVLWQKNLEFQSLPYHVNTTAGVTLMKKKGGQTSLSGDFENELVQCILTCCNWGYPVSSFDIRCFVKCHLDREGKKIDRFKDNMPGVKWAASFLSRYKTLLSQRMCQNVKRSRVQVSSKVNEDYFDELEKTLEGIPLEAIINFDETGLADDPGQCKLIFKKGYKYPERVMNETVKYISDVCHNYRWDSFVTLHHL